MKRISEAESQVMQALWARGPMTPEGLKAELAAAHAWAEPTIKTLISRLQKKGALRSERAAGRTTYVPLLTREAYLTAESRSLLDRLFDGQLAPLVSHFATQRELTAEDRARLRRLLAALDQDADD